jgi:hypothetical protein
LKPALVAEEFLRQAHQRTLVILNVNPATCGLAPSTEDYWTFVLALVPNEFGTSSAAPIGDIPF